MGRKASNAVITKTDVNSDALKNAAAASGELAIHFQGIAQKFGYELGYNRDRMVEEIRHYMGESARTMLAAGARLALIRSQEPHGEWLETCEVLNLEPRTAQRMISSALKFSNATTSSHLERLGTSKLFELLVLDDDDAEVLSSGGSIDGLGDLDAIGKMTVRELRASLREAVEENRAKDTVLAGKSKKIDTLQTQLQRKKADTPAEEWAWGPHRRSLLDTGEAIMNTIESELRRAVIEIRAFADESGGATPETVELMMAQTLGCVMQALVGIQTEFSVEVDLDSIITPPWMEGFEPSKPAGKKTK